MEGKYKEVRGTEACKSCPANSHSHRLERLESWDDEQYTVYEGGRIFCECNDGAIGPNYPQKYTTGNLSDLVKYSGNYHISVPWESMVNCGYGTSGTSTSGDSSYGYCQCVKDYCTYDNGYGSNEVDMYCQCEEAQSMSCCGNPGGVCALNCTPGFYYSMETGKCVGRPSLTLISPQFTTRVCSSVILQPCR